MLYDRCPRPSIDQVFFHSAAVLLLVSAPCAHSCAFYLCFVYQNKNPPNTGCILIPGAKQVIHFPDRDCSQKTAITSLWHHII